jgi:hypothetical protein
MTINIGFDARSPVGIAPSTSKIHKIDVSLRQVGSALDYVYLHVSVKLARLNSGCALDIMLTSVLNSTIVSIGSAIQSVCPYSLTIHILAIF